jgi:hypothetical protein
VTFQTDDTIYAFPKEWDENGDELCLRVDGNIYGTKDGGRSFTDYRDDWLVEEMGFVQSEHDPSLFIREPEELIRKCGPWT